MYVSAKGGQNVTAACSQHVSDELGGVAQLIEQQTLDDNAMDYMACLSAGEDAGALDDNAMNCMSC